MLTLTRDWCLFSRRSSTEGNRTTRWQTNSRSAKSRTGQLAD